MGVTAQQHRAVTGLFAAAGTGIRRTRRRKSGGGSTANTNSGQTTMPVIAVAIISLLLGCYVTSCAEVAINQSISQLSRSSSTDIIAVADDSASEESVPDLRGLLLLLAGDVEENPGPVSPQNLLLGIASLAADAPPGSVKNIILA